MRMRHTHTLRASTTARVPPPLSPDHETAHILRIPPALGLALFARRYNTRNPSKRTAKRVRLPISNRNKSSFKLNQKKIENTRSQALQQVWAK